MDAKAQLQEVKDRLAQLDPNNRDNLVQIATLRQQEIQLQQQIIVDEQNQAAAQLRIQDATEQAAYFLDNLVIEDLTMRELCVGELQYQMLRIAVQNKIIDLAEKASKQISNVQSEENAEKLALKQQIAQLNEKYSGEDKRAAEDQETILQLQYQLAQAKRETVDYQGKLKNATDEIERLESQVDDLRKEIAVGARNAFKVTDVEQNQQLKQIADQIKASKIKVTDMDFTDYTHITYTATLMQDLPSENKKFGDKIEFPSIFKSKYIEIKDAAEVERFRAEHASNQEAVSDSPLGDEKVADVTTGDTFPSLPSAIPPEVPDIKSIGTMAEGQQSVEVPGETIEERLAALEAHVFGYVKQAVA